MVWVRAVTITASLISSLVLATLIINTDGQVSDETGQSWTNHCPCRICDVDEFGKRRVVCDQGDMNVIPTLQMDTKANVRSISLNFTIDN